MAKAVLYTHTQPPAGNGSKPVEGVQKGGVGVVRTRDGDGVTFADGAVCASSADGGKIDMC